MLLLRSLTFQVCGLFVVGGFGCGGGVVFAIMFEEILFNPRIVFQVIPED